MNTQLKILFFSNSLFSLASSLLIPVYALFIKNSGGGVELAGMLFGLSFASAAVVDLFIIRLKDKKALSIHLLRANYLIRSICWFVLAFMPTIPVIALAQIIIGASTSIGSPAFNALVSENLDQKEHIREWGIWELLANPANALGSFLSGMVIVYFGFSALFIIMASIALISALILNSYKRSNTN